MAQNTATTPSVNTLTKEQLKEATKKMFDATGQNKKDAMADLKALVVRKNSMTKEDILKEVSNYLKELQQVKPPNRREADEMKGSVNSFLLEMLYLSFKKGNEKFLAGKDAALMFYMLCDTKLMLNFEFSLHQRMRKTNGKATDLTSTDQWRELHEEAIENKFDSFAVEQSNHLMENSFLLITQTKTKNENLVAQIWKESVDNQDKIKYRVNSMTDKDLLEYINKVTKQKGAIVPFGGWVEFLTNVEAAEPYVVTLFDIMQTGYFYQSRASLFISLIKSLRNYRAGEYSKNLTQPFEFHLVKPDTVKDILSYMIFSVEQIDTSNELSSDNLEKVYRDQSVNIRTINKELQEFKGQKMMNILNGVTTNLNDINNGAMSNIVDTSGKSFDERKADGTLTESEKKQINEDEKNSRKESRLSGKAESALAIGGQDSVVNFGTKKEEKSKKSEKETAGGIKQKKVSYGDQTINTVFPITGTMIQELKGGTDITSIATNIMQKKKVNTVDNRVIEGIKTVYNSLTSSDKRFIEMALISTYRAFLPTGSTLDRNVVRNEAQQKTFNANKALVLKFFDMIRDNCGYLPGWHQIDRAMYQVLRTYASKMPDLSSTTNAASPLIFFKDNGLQLAILGFLATKILLQMPDDQPLDIGTGSVESISDVKNFTMTPMKAFYLASQHNLSGSVRGDKRKPEVIAEQRKLQFMTWIMAKECMASAGVEVNEDMELGDCLRELRQLTQNKKRILTKTRKSVTPRAITFREDGYKTKYDSDNEVKKIFEVFNGAAKKYNNGTGQLLQIAMTDQEREVKEKEMRDAAPKSGKNQAYNEGFANNTNL